MGWTHFSDGLSRIIGGTLTQILDGSGKVISYFSRKLNDAQKNYSANDRELLGMIEFLKHLRSYLEWSEFEVITSNQVLKHFFDKKDLSRREARWLETLSEFGMFPITLQRGSVHVLGDVLSRVEHSKKTVELQNFPTIIREPNDLRSLKLAQENDQFFGPIIENIKNNKSTIRYQYEEGILRLASRELCVPRQYVKTVLELAHVSPSSGHYAETKTLARLKNYFWKKKTRDVQKYIKGCYECQKMEIHS